VSDRDELLRDAFDDFARAALPLVRPAGASAAVRRSTRRRRLLATGVLGLLVALVSMTVYASTRLTVPPVAPDPTRPAPSPAGMPSEVAEGTLDVDWTWAARAGSAGCRNGPVTFNAGHYLPPGDEPVQDVIRAVRTDVDRNGTDDYVIHLACRTDVSYDQVVAAYTRSGRVFTRLGTVVNTVQGGVRDVLDLAAEPDGRVRVLVGDLLVCCILSRYVGSVAPNAAVRQWRAYAWGGGYFTQTGGPTTFDADRDAARLAVAVPVLRMDWARGRYAGTLKITVTNHGPRPVRDLSLVLGVPALVPAPGGDWDRCHVPDRRRSSDAPSCELRVLPLGTSVVLRFPVTAGHGISASDNDGPLGAIHVHTGQFRYPAVPVDKRFY
jgi:hypothetical protein